ncbi:MAG: OsmC family peroxiredoxin [Nitrososphaerota archaeon]|nr:OsmC family peroxiredoxin [Nitrososphaerota archaeon]
MPATRNAEVVWEKDLLHGNGKVRVGSEALPVFGVTWASRVEKPSGKTSPEELLAAAQAACYAMALSSTLTRKGSVPEKLTVKAECDFDNAALKIRNMRISVVGQVPGLNLQDFRNAAAEAEKICPVANAIRNNVEISLTANLG